MFGQICRKFFWFLALIQKLNRNFKKSFKKIITLLSFSLRLGHLTFWKQTTLYSQNNIYTNNKNTLLVKQYIICCTLILKYLESRSHEINFLSSTYCLGLFSPIKFEQELRHYYYTVFLHLIILLQHLRKRRYYNNMCIVSYVSLCVTLVSKHI